MKRLLIAAAYTTPSLAEDVGVSLSIQHNQKRQRNRHDDYRENRDYDRRDDRVNNRRDDRNNRHGKDRGMNHEKTDIDFEFAQSN